MRQTLRKSEILRGKKTLSAVFDRGKRFDGAIIRCFVQDLDALPSPAVQRCRIGFTVAGSVRRAVDRNRMKRLLRESYRRNKELLLEPVMRANRVCAIVFLYSRKISHARDLPSYRQVEQDVRTILKRIAGG